MLTRVFVLGLLSFQPMSGYAIQHYLRLNRAEQWAAILPGSIHYALKKLAAEGLVTLQATEQTGYRTKVIYAITTAGMQEFHRLLEQLWSTPEPHYPVGLYTALTFLNALPREQVLAALGNLFSSFVVSNASNTPFTATSSRLAVGGLINRILVLVAFAWYVILASHMLMRERRGVKAPGAR